MPGRSTMVETNSSGRSVVVQTHTVWRSSPILGGTRRRRLILGTAALPMDATASIPTVATTVPLWTADWPIRRCHFGFARQCTSERLLTANQQQRRHHKDDRFHVTPQMLVR